MGPKPSDLRGAARSSGAPGIYARPKVGCHEYKRDGGPYPHLCLHGNVPVPSPFSGKISPGGPENAPPAAIPAWTRSFPAGSCLITHRTYAVEGESVSE